MLLICAIHCKLHSIHSGEVLTVVSGGMGLTGGFADIGGLYDCLIGMHQGLADDSILDKYDEMRRERYKNFIDPISTSNFKRLWQQDPDTAVENDEFFKIVKKAETDKEFAHQMAMVSCNLDLELFKLIHLVQGIHAISHDFTQYYNKPAPEQKVAGAIGVA